MVLKSFNKSVIHDFYNLIQSAFNFNALTLFEMSFFGAANGWARVGGEVCGCGKNAPFLKSVTHIL